MQGECQQQHCYAPDTTCHLGMSDHRKCSMWRERQVDSPVPSDTEEQVGLLLPWTGNSLGITDLPFLTAGANTKVVAVVGPYSSGKTTLLASLYLLLGRGKAGEEFQFAGSWTLSGWELIANKMRWKSLAGPAFPPHTTSQEARSPGLLHLSYRDETQREKHLLFADSPGEWFKLWSVNRDAQGCEGARWLSAHADMFLVLADQDALSGEERGIARSTAQGILRRVASERAGRPVCLVWSKSDKEIPPEMRSAVRSAGTDISSLDELSVSVYPENDGGRCFIRVLEWCLKQSFRNEFIAVAETSVQGDDPFFKYGVTP